MTCLLLSTYLRCYTDVQYKGSLRVQYNVSTLRYQICVPQNSIWAPHNDVTYTPCDFDSIRFTAIPFCGSLFFHFVGLIILHIVYLNSILRQVFWYEYLVHNNILFSLFPKSCKFYLNINTTSMMIEPGTYQVRGWVPFSTVLNHRLPKILIKGHWILQNKRSLALFASVRTWFFL